MNEEQRERLIVKLKRELGTTILDALADDAVIEVMLNPDGKLWVEKFGVGKYHAGDLLPSQSESIVSTVAAMLTIVGYSINGWGVPLVGYPINGCGFPLVE